MNNSLSSSSSASAEKEAAAETSACGETTSVSGYWRSAQIVGDLDGTESLAGFSHVGRRHHLPCELRRFGVTLLASAAHLRRPHERGVVGVV